MAAPNTPTLLVDRVTYQSFRMRLGEAFSDPDGHTHASSSWQITTAADTAFASPVVSIVDNTFLKTQWAPTTRSELLEDTDYLARVRVKDSNGEYSEWSTAKLFRTAKRQAVAARKQFTYAGSGDVGGAWYVMPDPDSAAHDLVMVGKGLYKVAHADGTETAPTTDRLAFRMLAHDEAGDRVFSTSSPNPAALFRFETGTLAATNLGNTGINGSSEGGFYEGGYVWHVAGTLVVRHAADRSSEAYVGVSGRAGGFKGILPDPDGAHLWVWDSGGNVHKIARSHFGSVSNGTTITPAVTVANAAPGATGASAGDNGAAYGQMAIHDGFIYGYRETVGLVAVRLSDGARYVTGAAGEWDNHGHGTVRRHSSGRWVVSGYGVVLVIDAPADPTTWGSITDPRALVVGRTYLNEVEGQNLGHFYIDAASQIHATRESGGASGYWYRSSIYGLPTTPPTVATNAIDASQEASRQLTLSGTLASNGAIITERGFYFGTTSPPTGKEVVAGTGDGTYTMLMTGLAPITTYYAQAYAIYGSGEVKGDVVSARVTGGAPVAPTGLEVVDATGGAYSLRWTDECDNVETVEVQRRKSGGADSDWIKVGEVAAGNITGQQVTRAAPIGVPPGMAVEHRIIVTNASGSATSGVASHTQPASATPAVRQTATVDASRLLDNGGQRCGYAHGVAYVSPYIFATPRSSSHNHIARVKEDDYSSIQTVKLTSAINGDLVYYEGACVARGLVWVCPTQFGSVTPQELWSIDPATLAATRRHTFAEPISGTATGLPSYVCETVTTDGNRIYLTGGKNVAVWDIDAATMTIYSNPGGVPSNTAFHSAQVDDTYWYGFCTTRFAGAVETCYATKLLKSNMSLVQRVEIPKCTDDMTQNGEWLFAGVEDDLKGPYALWGVLALRKSDMAIFALPKLGVEDVPLDVQSYASLVFGTRLMDYKTNGRLYHIDASNPALWGLTADPNLFVKHDTWLDGVVPTGRPANELLRDERGWLHSTVWPASDTASGLVRYQLPGVNLSGPPSVITLAPIVEQGVDVTLRGDVTDAGGATITERGFYHGTANPPTTKIVVAGTAVGSYDHVVPWPTDGQMYYVRAFATNSYGESLGTVYDYGSDSGRCHTSGGGRVVTSSRLQSRGSGKTSAGGRVLASGRSDAIPSLQGSSRTASGGRVNARGVLGPAPGASGSGHVSVGTRVGILQVSIGLQGGGSARGGLRITTATALAELGGGSALPRAIRIDEIAATDWSMRLGEVGLVAQGAEDVAQCIRLLLLTPKRSVPHHPEFGCDAWAHVDRPISVARPHIVREVVDAVHRWERRARLESVTVEEEVGAPAALRVTVRFHLPGVGAGPEVVSVSYSQ